MTESGREEDIPMTRTTPHDYRQGDRDMCLTPCGDVPFVRISQVFEDDLFDIRIFAFWKLLGVGRKAPEKKQTHTYGDMS